MSQDNNPEAMAETEDNQHSNDSGSESHENGSDENRSSYEANASSSTAPSGGQDNPHQPPSHETFQNYKQARLDHNSEWYGEKHPEPPLGHPDRRFLFSQNEPISTEEFADALKRYDDSIVNPETGEPGSLNVHVRSSTPPLERVEKQVQGLAAAGQEVSPELAMEIHNNLTSNSGIFTALLEWSPGKAEIPIDQVNNLVKWIDQLKLAMAEKERDSNKMLHESNAEKKLLKEHHDERERSRDSEVARLRNELQSKENEISESTIQSAHRDRQHREAIQALENDLRVEKEENKASNERNRLDSQAAKDKHSVDLKALSGQLEGSQRDHQALQGQLEENQTNYQALQDELKESQTNYQALQDNLKEIQTSYQALQHRFEGSQRDCQALQDQLAESQANCQTLRDQLQRRQKEYQALQSQLQVRQRSYQGLEEEREAERIGREGVDQEVAKYVHFHQEMYKQLQVHARTWALAKIGVDSLPTDDATTTRQSRVMIGEASKDWAQLKKSYEEEWPRMKTSAVRERLHKDQIVLGALKHSEEEQKASWERNLQLRDRRPQGQNESEAEEARPELAQRPPSSGDSSQEPRNFKELERTLNELKQTSSAYAEAVLDKDKEIQSLSDELRTCKEELKAYRGAERINREPAESSDPIEDAGRLRRRIDHLEDEIRTLREENKTLTSQATISRNDLIAEKRATFTTAEDLVQAVRVQDGNSNAAELGLMDRINYLNLACFIRTRNYIQFAFREGANRLADILINDAHQWVEFCRDDFQSMDPRVISQIDSSLRILHGLRRILTATNQQELEKGRSHIDLGRRTLQKFGDSIVFDQLGRLADSIIENTRAENDNSLFKRKFRFDQYSGYWPKKRIDQEKMRKVIKRGPNMRAGAMRTGFHAPLSPERWSRDNPNAGVDTPETRV
ncbi:hypothetical protein ACHAPU_010033 [Fusarium lateritium]